MGDTITNPTLQETVTTETPLKEWLVNYVGEQQTPDSEEVTVEMIVETVAKEFPEFMMAIAEENWVRGYYQAMVDVEQGTKAIREAVHNRGRENTTEQQNTGTDTTTDGEKSEQSD
jgi:hypothetical protein